MVKSIREFRNNDQLIEDLKARNLVFPDQDSIDVFKKYLIQYGYFSFIKKLSHDLMYSDVENKIYKSEFTSNNLRYLFDIDRNISVIIFKYFRSIEFILNSALLKIVAKKLNKLVECPYLGALSAENLDNLFPNLDQNINPHNKKNGVSNSANFYNDFYKNFVNRDIDCFEVAKINKKNENTEIKKLIENGWLRKRINADLKKKVRSNWEYLDIFSLFQILTFSQLVRIFSFLSTSSKNEVIKEFCNNFKPLNKHSKLKDLTFLKLINALSDLRNVLMHNGAIIKFDYQISEKELKNLNDYFNLNIKDNYIKLNEIILIMEAIINIKDRMKEEIDEMIKEKFKKRTKRSDVVSDLIKKIISDETRLKLK